MVIRKPTKPRTSRTKRDPEAQEWQSKDPTLWEDLLAIARLIPPESLEKIPADLGRNADHYLDGSPKQE